MIYSTQVVQAISSLAELPLKTNRCGRPVTVAADQNVAKVKCVTHELE